MTLPPSKGLGALVPRLGQMDTNTNEPRFARTSLRSAALSNVRRDGLILRSSRWSMMELSNDCRDDRFSDFRISRFSDFRIFGFLDFVLSDFWLFVFLDFWTFGLLP